MDMAAPDTSTPARTVLTLVDNAVRNCMGPLPGPVHLNCQYREPLGPGAETWPEMVLEVSVLLQQSDDNWLASIRP